MTTKTRTYTAAGTLAAALLLSGAALAEPVTPASDTFTGATRLNIDGFMGVVNVETASDFSVELTGADKGGPVQLVREGGTVTVDGDEKAVKKAYRRGSPWQKNRWWGGGDEAEEKFAEYLADYPVLTVRMPAGTDMKIEKSALILTAPGAFGELDVQGLYEAYGTIGTAQTASLGISGQGELKMGSVTGALTIAIAGSGDIEVEQAGSARVRISGSGDVDLGQVSQFLKVEIAGSGDVETGTVGGGFDVQVSGSGDVEVASVNGPTQIQINGSGDIEIDDGRAEDFTVRVNGSGDVSFGGTAINPDVRVNGVGDVTVSAYEGSVNVRGDGDVRIGELRFGD